tara:strand:+ start:191 stop:871 length:681 start_codon:yes stop_codon:yes gene_type:complete
MKNSKVHFIDCGANWGLAIKWAKRKYGERLVKIDAFEPEMANFNKILVFCSEENKDELDIVVHQQAVWIKNEVRPFFVQHWGTRTGSSIVKNKEQILKKGQVWPAVYLGSTCPIRKEDQENFRFTRGGLAIAMADLNCNTVKMNVQCIDLFDWIKRNVNKENYNILKIDIEGAEYEVIKHLLNHGAQEYIDEWLVEFTEVEKVPEDYDQEVVDKFKSTVTNYKDWR